MQTTAVTTCILGGGLSGLFAGHFLERIRLRSYVVVNDNEVLGGYAAKGGMKVGFLPAGEKTAKILGNDYYEESTNQFIAKYTPGIDSSPRNKFINFNSEHFTNKYYESALLTKQDVGKMVTELKNEIRHNLIISPILTVYAHKDGYKIETATQNITCKYLIIASGRDDNTTTILSHMGTKYEENVPLLTGCRASFTSDSVDTYFYHQRDFKIKFTNGFQTYCFNKSGPLYAYKHRGTSIFSGTFSPSGTIGNVFIGKRTTTTFNKAIETLNNVRFTIRNSNLEDFDLLPIRDESFKKEFKHTLTVMKNDLRFNFLSFHFPALEQFWPRPALREHSLESAQHNNLFFIGDCSGVSFGVLQCYVTAKFVVDRIRRTT